MALETTTIETVAQVQTDEEKAAAAAATATAAAAAAVALAETEAAAAQQAAADRTRNLMEGLGSWQEKTSGEIAQLREENSRLGSVLSSMEQRLSTPPPLADPPPVVVVKPPETEHPEEEAAQKAPKPVPLLKRKIRLL